MITVETIKWLKLWNIREVTWYAFKRGSVYRCFYVIKKTAKSFTIREPYAYGEPETTLKMAAKRDAEFFMANDIVPVAPEYVEYYERIMLKSQWENAARLAPRLTINLFRSQVRELERTLKRENIT